MADVGVSDAAATGDEKVDSSVPSPEQMETKETLERQNTASPSPSADNTSKDWKVEIWLKQTGNAPILQKKKWCVPASFKIADVIKFVRKFMKLDGGTSLFLYVNQAFAPSPDDEVGNVYKCFNMNGRLVFHYSTSPAWG